MPTPSIKETISAHDEGEDLPRMGSAPSSISMDGDRDSLVIINNKPATAHSMLAALIDIYDDAQNNAPEHRCYVESAWPDVLKEARAFLLSAAPQSDGWRPIESAPHDGTHVRLYAPEIQFVGFHAVAGWCYVAPGCPLAPTQPTHWEPLSPAPTQGEES